MRSDWIGSVPQPLSATEAMLRRVLRQASIQRTGESLWLRIDKDTLLLSDEEKGVLRSIFGADSFAE
jgi:hypothetical protein